MRSRIPKQELELLGRVPLFSGCNQSELREIARLGTELVIEPGRVLTEEGAPGREFFLVVEGKAECTIRGRQVAVFGTGDYFGELALLRTSTRRTATVQALEPAVTLAIGGAAFRRLCEQRPRVERALTTLLADQVDSLSRHLLEALYEGLDARVHHRLAELAATYGSDHGAVVLPLTQAQLAELAGGTRPTVNQILRRLEARGVIALGRGRVTVLDAARLADRQGRGELPR